MARSEDLAAQVFPRWLRHSGHLPGTHYVRQEPPPTDLSDAELGRAYNRLSQLSARWRAVEVGASMTVGLVLAVLALIMSAIVWALGANSSNRHLAGRGKLGVLVALGAAIVCGASVTLVNFFWNVGQQV